MTLPEKCERCGGPSYNVGTSGDPTGRHIDIEECVRELAGRVAKLEAQAKLEPVLRCRICGERLTGAAHGVGVCGDKNVCGLCGNFLMQADGTIGSHGRGLCVSVDRNGRITSRRKKQPRLLKCAKRGCGNTTDKNPVPGTAWMCAEHDAAEKARVAKETT